MKKLILLYIIGSLVANTVNCQTKEKNNTYFYNALAKGFEEYISQERVSDCEYSLYFIKVMQIEEEWGEFTLDYNLNDGAYKDMNPTHYIYLEEELIMVKLYHEIAGKKLEKYGILPITQEIEEKAYDTLAGPNMSITAQPSPLMIVKYKKEKVKYKYDPLGWAPDHKYYLSTP